MSIINLDFRNVKYFMEIHKVLKQTFGFPEYYGENLSALWDCLYEFCPLDAKIEIDGISYLNEKFGATIKLSPLIYIICNRLH